MLSREKKFGPADKKVAHFWYRHGSIFAKYKILIYTSILKLFSITILKLVGVGSVILLVERRT